MKKNLNILLVLLLASVLIMACSLFSAGTDEVAAPADVEESVEAADEPTPVPDMDISGLVLTSADFPDIAFTDVSLEEMGMSVEDLNSEDFTVESFFALIESTNFEMVMGFTTQVGGPLKRAGFDLVLNQPDVLLESFLVGMGDMGASEPVELPEFKDAIGDSSAGMTVIADVEGMGMRVDMVVFRNGPIGAFAITMYLDGQTPPAALMDVAQKFDEKIEVFLASQ